MQEPTAPINGVALIDADMIVYEAAACGQDRETGEVFSFDYVAGLVDKRITEIMLATGASEYKLYLTGENNFRFDVATVVPYKSKRNPEKPWHYKNVRVYMESLGAVVVDGMEADDAMAMDQGENTIICTRDKDLRQVPGWHYGWELGAQPEFALQYVDELGKIELLDKKPKEVKGTGLRFFYAQLIIGDTVDTIPGLPGKGAVFAYKLLDGLETEEEMFNAVLEAYEVKYGEEGRERLLEQGRLLWMCRETDDTGAAVQWRLPNFGGDTSDAGSI